MTTQGRLNLCVKIGVFVSVRECINDNEMFSVSYNV